MMFRTQRSIFPEFLLGALGLHLLVARQLELDVLDGGGEDADETERQQQHVYRSTKAARLDGITHLLHIDDDELLVCPRGSDALRRIALEAGPEKADLHCLNIEALVPIESDVSCANPFREARAFRYQSKDFCSYGTDESCTGKSIGVLSHEGLSMDGPHHFKEEHREEDLPIEYRMREGESPRSKRVKNIVSASIFW